MALPKDFPQPNPQLQTGEALQPRINDPISRQTLSDYEMGLRVLSTEMRKMKEAGMLHPDTVLALRVPEREDAIIHIHPKFTFYFGVQTLVIRDSIVSLKQTQSQVLDLICRRPNRIVLSSTIVQQIWGYDLPYDEAQQLVKGHISLIRQAFSESGEESEKVLRNVIGAGYLLFDEERLKAEHQAIQKRKGEAPIDVEERISAWSHQDFVLYPEMYGAMVPNASGENMFVEFTKLEMDMLDLFTRRVNRVVPQGLLYELMGEESEQRYIKTHVSHIRTKLLQGRRLPYSLIRSVWDVGYILQDPFRLPQHFHAENTIFQEEQSAIEL